MAQENEMIDSWSFFSLFRYWLCLSCPWTPAWIHFCMVSSPPSLRGTGWRYVGDSSPKRLLPPAHRTPIGGYRPHVPHPSSLSYPSFTSPPGMTSPPVSPRPITTNIDDTYKSGTSGSVGQRPLPVPAAEGEGSEGLSESSEERGVLDLYKVGSGYSIEEMDHGYHPHCLLATYTPPMTSHRSRSQSVNGLSALVCRIRINPSRQCHSAENISHFPSYCSQANPRSRSKGQHNLWIGKRHRRVDRRLSVDVLFSKRKPPLNQTESLPVAATDAGCLADSPAACICASCYFSKHARQTTSTTGLPQKHYLQDGEALSNSSNHTTNGISSSHSTKSTHIRGMSDGSEHAHSVPNGTLRPECEGIGCSTDPCGELTCDSSGYVLFVPKVKRSAVWEDVRIHLLQRINRIIM